MQLFCVLSVLSLLFGALASPQFLDSREPHPHRVEPRQIGTNLCVPIEITSTIVGLLPFGIAYVTEGSGARCLCFSTIPSAIAVEVIQYAYEFAPEPTNEFINDFVNSIDDGDSGCSYPDYSIPTCVGGSATGCEFTCIAGYTLASSGTSCDQN